MLWLCGVARIYFFWVWADFFTVVLTIGCQHCWANGFFGSLSFLLTNKYACLLACLTRKWKQLLPLPDILKWSAFEYCLDVIVLGALCPLTLYLPDISLGVIQFVNPQLWYGVLLISVLSKLQFSVISVHSLLEFMLRNHTAILPSSVIFVTKIKTRTRIIGRRFQRTITRIIVIQKTKTK